MPDARPGILLVTRNFPPLRGGMERLNQRMLEGLARHGRVDLVGPAGCAAFAAAATQVRQAPAAPLWRFLPAALAAALQLARRHRPRLVLAGSGLAAPLAWLAARSVRARCAVYLHGLDLIVPNRAYQTFWLPFIRRCDIAIANSRNTARLAIERGVDPARLHVVHPGTDLPAPDPGARARFRDTHGLGERPLLLSVGRLTARKGLAEFVRDILPGVLAGQPDALLLVIGADATDALAAQAGSTRQRIIDAARGAGVEHALRLLPPCDDAALGAAYRAADLHVFPVRAVAGDVEGFGMVAVEAAAHGLPTVAFRVGGVADAVVDDVTGTLVAAADHAAFVRAVLDWLPRSRQAGTRGRCAEAARVFAWDRFDAQLQALLSKSSRAGKP
jgi:phosphatidylinositol alpha-1,6-mannosyltransferase